MMLAAAGSMSLGVALFLVSMLLILVVGYLLVAGDREGQMVDEDPPTLDVQNHRDD